MDERLTKLEMKLAYAEETIVTLDQVVTDQAKEIALLTAPGSCCYPWARTRRGERR